VIVGAVASALHAPPIPSSASDTCSPGATLYAAPLANNAPIALPLTVAGIAHPAADDTAGGRIVTLSDNPGAPTPALIGIGAALLMLPTARAGLTVPVAATPAGAPTRVAVATDTAGAPAPAYAPPLVTTNALSVCNVGATATAASPAPDGAATAPVTTSGDAA